MVSHWGVLRFLLARMKRKRGAGRDRRRCPLDNEEAGGKFGQTVKNILVGSILASAFFLEGDTGCLSAP